MKLKCRIAVLIWALIAVALLCSACDPGVSYTPKDWANANYSYSRSFDELDVEMPRLGGLIGRKWLTPEVSIRNRGKYPATLERVVLKANGSEYPAKPASPEGVSGWEGIQPGATRRVTLDWEFDRPIYEILKDPVALRMSFKVGSEEKVIDVPMLRTQG
ncbi:MAG: hypothetical protein ACJ741_16915 [Pyrinomonadaceae bacterium]